MFHCLNCHRLHHSPQTMNASKSKIQGNQAFPPVPTLPSAFYSNPSISIRGMPPRCPSDPFHALPSSPHLGRTGGCRQAGTDRQLPMKFIPPLLMLTDPQRRQIRLGHCPSFRAGSILPTFLRFVAVRLGDGRPFAPEGPLGGQLKGKFRASLQLVNL